MMETEHYRDAFHTYLVLPEPEEAQQGGYQYRMLAANKIPGLLPCGLRTVDGERKLCYDITARQKLSVFYAERGIDAAGMRQLVTDLAELKKELTAYLLDPEHLLMEGEYVYYDLSAEHFLFLYYPDEGGRDMKAFFTEVAELVREEDREAVRLAYRLVSCADDREVLFERLEAEVRGNSEEPETEDWEETDKTEDAWAGGSFYDRKGINGGAYASGERNCGTVFDRPDLTDQSSDSVLDNTAKNQQEKGTYRLSLTAALSLLGCVGTAAYPMFFPVTERQLLICRCLAIFLFLAALTMGVVLLLSLRKRKKQRREKAAAGLYGPDIRLFREEMQREQLYTERKDREQGRKSRQGTRASSTPSAGDLGGTVFLGFEGERASGLYSEDPGTPNIDLRKLPLTVGRTEGYADRVIEDGSVSRMHVRFSRDDQGDLLMRDLNSTNGTWLNGNLLEPESCVHVHRGDEIRIGETLYQCR